MWSGEIHTAQQIRFWSIYSDRSLQGFWNVLQQQTKTKKTDKVYNELKETRGQVMALLSQSFSQNLNNFS